MHRISIKNFGPITACEMEIGNYTVLTGPQASGKSTISKAVFFFRTIKNDICEIIIKSVGIEQNENFDTILRQKMRRKFLQMFGTSRAMSGDMELCYYYNTTTWVKIRLGNLKGEEIITPNFILIDFSEPINEYLRNISLETPKEHIIRELSCLFNDECETIFIPAGRSLLSILTDQLMYFFNLIDEEQRKTIDYCTQEFIKQILKIRPFFSYGAESYASAKEKENNEKNVHVRYCLKASRDIVKGEYRNVASDERLYLENGRYVKINHASSGQQESLWLINVLLYQLINKIKTFLIIEEPEAHLYPDSQKIIMEMVSAFVSYGNAALITTHSPYILGSINNMLMAAKLARNENGKMKEISSVVSEILWLDKGNAFYVDNGTAKSCNEDDGVLIRNEVIDGASDKINSDYDSLFEIGGEDDAI